MAADEIQEESPVVAVVKAGPVEMVATGDGGNGSLETENTDGDTTILVVKSALIDCGKTGEDVVST